jgi:hypothetical protein
MISWLQMDLTLRNEATVPLSFELISGAETDRRNVKRINTKMKLRKLRGAWNSRGREGFRGISFVNLIVGGNHEIDQFGSRWIKTAVKTAGGAEKKESGRCKDQKMTDKGSSHITIEQKEGVSSAWYLLLNTLFISEFTMNYHSFPRKSRIRARMDDLRHLWE